MAVTPSPEHGVDHVDDLSAAVDNSGETYSASSNRNPISGLTTRVELGSPVQMSLGNDDPDLQPTRREKSFLSSRRDNNRVINPNRPSAKNGKASKQYTCVFSPYGCPAVFASRKEWRRHIISQHLQLGFYRCDIGLCNPGDNRTRSYNDFNRKDLFTQHHRRMHLPFSGRYEDASVELRESFERSMESVGQRCWVDRRELPKHSSCGFCGRSFLGVTGWEEYMEHVAQHIEKGETTFEEDVHLTQWAISEGIVRDLGEQGRWLVGMEPTNLEGKGDKTARQTTPSHRFRVERDYYQKEHDSNRQIAQPTTAFADSALDSSVRAAGFFRRIFDHQEETSSLTTDLQDMAIPHELRSDLVSEFADILYRDLCKSMVRGLELIAREADVITQLLPQALMDFTRQLERPNATNTEWKAMLLVRDNREGIAVRFSDFIDVSPSDPADALPPDELLSGSKQMSIEEKVDSWKIAGSASVPEESNMDDRHFRDEQEISTARCFLMESMPFKWLLGLLRVAATTTLWKKSELQSINDTVRIHLAGIKPKGMLATGQEAIFVVEWDPLKFMEEQGYSGDERSILDKIITINGSLHEAQALTCAQYMQQTWPATGADTLGAIVSALAGDRSEFTHKRLLSCGLELFIYVGRDYLTIVRARGEKSLLAELASQLSWLCATCRTGSRKDQLAQSTPEIEAPEEKEPFFRIKAFVTDIDDYEAKVRRSGACWHRLFSNAVLVSDAPIAIREHDEEGLEAPLNMIAALGEAAQASVFDELVLVKGHSTMFVPTKYTEDSICWHFLCNVDGSRLPYWAAKSLVPNHLVSGALTMHELADARHFVGWTPFASSRAGTKNAVYSAIDYSQLDTAGKSIAAERATLTAGMYITGGVSFVRGERDRPTYLSSVGSIYEVQLSSARNSYVTLYDAADHRAWLLDGASALLHLTRTQIEQPPYNQNSQTFLDKFCYSQPDHGADAALRALQDETNRRILIFTKSERETVMIPLGGTSQGQVMITTKEWCFQDLVQQTWYDLERLIDRQCHIAMSNFELRCSTQEELLGFEFMDLVRRKPLLMTRVAILRSSGRGWPDLTKRIGAPCLVGRGFGDLIAPGKPIGTTPSTLCRRWSQMPKGKDYLASLTATLREICREHGSKDSEPLRLAHGLYWYQLRNPFGNCANKCQRGRRQNCDPLQIVSPTLHGASRKTPDAFSEDRGAIIFGKSRRLDLDWAHIKFPWTGRDAEADTESDQEQDVQDSGLGSSMMTSTSGSSTVGDGRQVEASANQLPAVHSPLPQRSPAIIQPEDRVTGSNTLAYLERVYADDVHDANIPPESGARRELFSDSAGRTEVLSNADTTTSPGVQSGLDTQHRRSPPSVPRSGTRRRRLEDENNPSKRARSDRG